MAAYSGISEIHPYAFQELLLEKMKSKITVQIDKSIKKIREKQIDIVDLLRPVLRRHQPLQASPHLYRLCCQDVHGQEKVYGRKTAEI